MADYNRTKQSRAFARVDGAYLGIIWVIAFAFFVMQYSEPALGMVNMFVSVFSLFFAYSRLVKFRREVCDDAINFGGAYVHVLFMFFYAALIMGLAQYIYFKFIDGGYLLDTYSQIMLSEEFKEASKASGISVDNMKEALGQLSKARPVDIAINFLSMNIFGSFFLSVPMALFAMKRKK